MLSLVLLTALAQPAPEPPAPSALPPEQALAVIDAKGNLTFTRFSAPCYGPANQDAEVTVFEKKGDEKVPVKAKVKVTSVVLTTATFPAKYVEAYTVEGTAIPREKLADLLAKERTVLVATDGKKVDPFLLTLYKEGTIVLVSPANTLGMGGGGPYFVPGYNPPPEEIRPVPLPPVEKPKDPPLEKKP